jgi:hypothetical protein
MKDGRSARILFRIRFLLHPSTFRDLVRTVSLTFRLAVGPLLAITRQDPVTTSGEQKHEPKRRRGVGSNRQRPESHPSCFSNLPLAPQAATIPVDCKDPILHLIDTHWQLTQIRIALALVTGVERTVAYSNQYESASGFQPTVSQSSGVPQLPPTSREDKV